MAELFDNMPDVYEQWFETPLGAVIKQIELELVLGMLKPEKNDIILDAGCGTGVFTSDILKITGSVTGLDVSKPMLAAARRKMPCGFNMVCADMLKLPFKDDTFDKTISITAVEFIVDARIALQELARVTKTGGLIIAATLNSRSPWAIKRKKVSEDKGGIFVSAIFRSPVQLAELLPYESTWKTCIHFSDDAAPEDAFKVEEQSRIGNPDNGAFLACAWKKPLK